jgi:hypothetical protein
MKKEFAIGLFLAMFGFVAITAFGTALTAGRDTPSRGSADLRVGVATNTRVFAGSMVALDAGGHVIPAANTAAQVVLGRAVKTVDNRVNATDAGDDGALSVDIERGIFQWANNDTITDADIGSTAYVRDDQTVSVTNIGNGTIAGVIVDLDAGGVWVDVSRTFAPFGVASQTYTNLGPTTAITNVLVVKDGRIDSITNIGP